MYISSSEVLYVLINTENKDFKAEMTLIVNFIQTDLFFCLRSTAQSDKRETQKKKENYQSCSIHF